MPINIDFVRITNGKQSSLSLPLMCVDHRVFLVPFLLHSHFLVRRPQKTHTALCELIFVAGSL
jgi:hypothetical protein